MILTPINLTKQTNEEKKQVFNNILLPKIIRIKSKQIVIFTVLIIYKYVTCTIYLNLIGIDLDYKLDFASCYFAK